MTLLLWMLDDEGEPVSTTDPLEWAGWKESHSDDCKVLFDRVGDVQISTIFLGLDCNVLQIGPPILYETMIFGGVHDLKRWRYHTRLEALTGHQHAVELVKTGDAVDRP